MILCLPQAVKRNSKLFRALLHFCVFAAVALPVSAQVYKWVDENGITHYGERPPQGRKATEVPDRLATPAPEVPNRLAMPAPDAGPANRADTDKVRAEADKRSENCMQQRELLARLKQTPKPASEPHEGAVARDPEREATQARQEQAVSKACT